MRSVDESTVGLTYWRLQYQVQKESVASPDTETREYRSFSDIVDSIPVSLSFSAFFIRPIFTGKSAELEVMTWA